MLRPIRDFIVLSVIKQDEKVGLIFRPATIDEKIVTGKVLAVGSGYLTDQGTVVPLEIKADDTIVFNKTMSVEIKNQGETYYLIREEHVLSVVE